MIPKKDRQQLLKTLGKYPYKKVHDYFVENNITLKGDKVVSYEYIRMLLKGDRSTAENKFVEEHIYRAVLDYQKKENAAADKAERIMQKIKKNAQEGPGRSHNN